ncbi:MAG: cation transporter [Rhodospirillales bacterium]|nr:cation transporter [Rhodospirillales bacterium]
MAGMKVRPPFPWPPDKAQLLHRADRLEWATLFFMSTVVVVMWLAQGSSQAMRSAWIEDVLSLVPATTYLIARRFEERPPDHRFPFGYYNAIPLAYLVSATTILIFAGYMIYSSGKELLSDDHPSIGLVSVFGNDVWMGWVMMAALLYSVIPPMVLGAMKTPVAEELHDKVLIADAAMQRADWKTGLAALAGVAGVGFGLWWADAVAALIIAVDVLNDGRRHVLAALRDLADEIPMTFKDRDEDPVTEEVRAAVLALDWVAEAEVALRDEGHPVSGTIYIRPKEPEPWVERLRDACNAAHAADWRTYDLNVVVLPPEPRS